MFAIPWQVALLFLGVYAAGGALLGLMSGLVARGVLRTGFQRLWLSAILGAVGVVTAYVFSAVVPWPENTVVEHLPNSTAYTTMNRYQHPERMAVFLALLLPFLAEFFRFRRARN